MLKSSLKIDTKKDKENPTDPPVHKIFLVKRLWDTELIITAFKGLIQ